MFEYCPLCDWFCLSNVTCMTSLHVMRSPTPSPTVYALWLFEVCIQVQILPHERHQCLPRKRKGVENPCTFLIGENLPGHPQSDHKMMELLWLPFWPTMASEAISEHLNSKNFLGKHALQTPLVLHAYIQIRHPCNPPSRNPDYKPNWHGTSVQCVQPLPVSGHPTPKDLLAPLKTQK